MKVQDYCDGKFEERKEYHEAIANVWGNIWRGDCDTSCLAKTHKKMVSKCLSTATGLTQPLLHKLGGSTNHNIFT